MVFEQKSLRSNAPRSVRSEISVVNSLCPVFSHQPARRAGEEYNIASQGLKAEELKFNRECCFSVGARCTRPKLFPLSSKGESGGIIINEVKNGRFVFRGQPACFKGRDKG